jgi:hypothetical protein
MFAYLVWEDESLGFGPESSPGPGPAIRLCAPTYLSDSVFSFPSLMSLIPAQPRKIFFSSATPGFSSLRFFLWIKKPPPTVEPDLKRATKLPVYRGAESAPGQGGPTSLSAERTPRGHNVETAVTTAWIRSPVAGGDEMTENRELRMAAIKKSDRGAGRSNRRATTAFGAFGPEERRGPATVRSTEMNVGPPVQGDVAGAQNRKDHSVCPYDDGLGPKSRPVGPRDWSAWFGWSRW